MTRSLISQISKFALRLAHDVRDSFVTSNSDLYFTFEIDYSKVKEYCWREGEFVIY